MTFQIIENFLPSDDGYAIHECLTSPEVPWNFNWSTASTNDDCGHGYFTHEVFKSNTDDPKTHMVYSTQGVALLGNLLLTRGVDYLRYIKFNMYPRTQEIVEHGKHFDVVGFREDQPWSQKGEKTILYYVNDNDGFTKYFPDGKDPIIVPSRFNTAVYTDENIMHNSSTCTDKPARITININFR